MTTALKIVGPERAAESDDARVGLVRRVYADAIEVAEVVAPEAPVFCYSAEALRQRIHEFVDGFPGEVAYAVKANSDADVLLTMAACGIAVFDAASVEEMALVRSLVPRARFHYHNPVKSRSEVARAYLVHGCRRFAADDPGEIAKLAAILGDVPGIEIAVRFRLSSNGAALHDFSSKFGAAPSEAAGLLEDVERLGFLPVLTFHPGSQCLDPAAYGRHIVEAARIAAEAGVELAALNVGGGFPARYHASTVPPLDDYFRAIAEAVEQAFGKHRAPALECEPGRGLVASAVSLLTRVKLVRHQRREVFLNDGIYGALMEASQVPALMPHYRVIRHGVPVVGQRAPFIVYGPTCDPLDRLPLPLELPVDIAEDDYVEFGSLGAYGAATATRFNGYEVTDVVAVRQTL